MTHQPPHSCSQPNCHTNVPLAPLSSLPFPSSSCCYRTGQKLLTFEAEISRERVPLRNAYKAAGQRVVIRINGGEAHTLSVRVVVLLVVSLFWWQWQLQPQFAVAAADIM